MSLTDDYSLYSPEAYLDEYYLDWDREDGFMAQFLHSVYSDLKLPGALLDISSGPVINHLISARRAVSKIIVSDYLPANRLIQENWRSGTTENEFDWDKYFKHIAQLEGNEGQPHVIDSMKQELKTKIQKIVPCNLRHAPPVKLPASEQIDVISMQFVAEAIAQNPDEFQAFMRNVVSMAKPNGFLVLSFLVDSNEYAVGRHTFRNLPIKANFVLKVLKSLNCKIITAQKLATPERIYKGYISVLAQKK